MTPRTRLVSVSHVRFDDGSLLDVPRLAKACRRNGTLLLLDVSQSCGAVPIDVREIGADFMVCAGYKYLLSPWGTGFVWARREHLEFLRPGPYSWVAQDVDTFARLNYVNPEPPPTLKRWDAAEASSLYNFNLAVMEASVDFVLRATPAAIFDHNQALISYLLERLPERCNPASPLEPVRRGVFGCFTAGTREETAELYAQLREARFVVALREGKIRVAPHLMNSKSDIDGLVEQISETLKGLPDARA